jgi:hypothetical protein
MTLKYEIGKSDYRNFYKSFYKKKVILYNNIILLFTPILALYFAYTCDVFNFLTINELEIPGSIISNNLWLKSIYDLALIVGLIFLLRRFFIWRIIRLINKYPYLMGERELRICEEVICIKSKYILREFSFKIIESLEIDNEYCYIYINFSEVIIIPKNINGFEEFFLNLKEKINVR